MTQIALIRHYPTPWNLEQRLQGQVDIGLTDEARATLAGLKLPPPWDGARMIASTLLRARDTADLLADGRAVHHDARLIEISWGDWEGKHAKDLLADPSSGFIPTHEWDADTKAPGGESRRDAWDRTRPALGRYRGQSNACRDRHAQGLDADHSGCRLRLARYARNQTRTAVSDDPAHIRLAAQRPGPNPFGHQMTARIVFLCCHLSGTGHLVRTLRLARAARARGHMVTVISGGRPLAHIAPGDVDLIQLPALTVQKLDFSTLLAPDGTPASADYLANRRTALTRAITQAAPDVLITELFPFGRRMLADEFLSAIQAAAPALILSSVRDIPEPKPKRLAQTADRLIDHYNGVLVHGDARSGSVGRDVALARCSGPDDPSYRLCRADCADPRAAQ